MADMIEKLVELMAKADEHRDEICVGHGCERCAYEQYGECGIQIKAEYLIANGVTVTDNNVGGKWIPVTERLPETFGSFLVTIKEHHGKNRYSTDCADFDPFAKTWKTFNYWCVGMEVTHWMPLPEPPKGE